MMFHLSNITVTVGLKDLPLYLLHNNSDNNLFYFCGVTFDGENFICSSLFQT
jgi:hypothetical protein